MIRPAIVLTAALVCLCALTPAPASASLIGKACNLAGGLAGKACDLASNPGRIVSTGKNLVTGHLGSALKDVLGGASSGASTALAIGAVVAWTVEGAKFALDETAKVLTETTRPNLKSTWFSAAYWRMAGIAALLTLPFLFAAAIQALMRSDLGLLTQAALGYLPLAMLAVSIAAPVAMLLLAATDQLCALVSSAGARGGSRLLAGAGVVLTAGHALSQPFITFLLAAITAGGALILWLELAVREAAVYVIVLMLPLAFAALVWPARRVWAVRAVELLVALILSKFAIVAVLGLAGAALGQGSQGGLTTALAGTVLVLLATFAPWALLRLIPMSELAAGATATLRPELERALHHGVREDGAAAAMPAGQRTDGDSRSGAESVREQMREQEGSAVESRREQAPSPVDERGTASAAGDRAAPPDSNGRPAVLVPVGAPTETAAEAGTEEPAREEPVREDRPPMALTPESFGSAGEWQGQVNGIASGPPGDDRDPRPPSDDEGLL